MVRGAGEAEISIAGREIRGPHVGERRVPDLMVREAREALTTAGYKAHEARAAVERALVQVSDEVTLPQLIYRAFQCIAGR
jgi:Holliday junction resolvasome RuvABC DNA-binding subunit